MTKDEYYMNIAKTVALKSTCLRRKYGAVIVKDDEIISTGYNGAPRGFKNCDELNGCLRDKLNIPHGQRYEICRSVHAEQNAIISASRRDMKGATLYLVGINPENPDEIIEGVPCQMCERFIVNSGIKDLVVYASYKTYRKLVDYKESKMEEDEFIKIRRFENVGNRYRLLDDMKFESNNFSSLYENNNSCEWTDEIYDEVQRLIVYSPFLKKIDTGNQGIFLIKNNIPLSELYKVKGINENNILKFIKSFNKRFDGTYKLVYCDNFISIKYLKN